MKPITIASTTDWAKEYIAYLVKEEFLDEEDIKGLSDKQLVKLAVECESAAQARYDEQKENGI